MDAPRDEVDQSLRFGEAEDWHLSIKMQNQASTGSQEREKRSMKALGLKALEIGHYLRRSASTLIEKYIDPKTMEASHSPSSCPRPNQHRVGAGHSPSAQSGWSDGTLFEAPEPFLAATTLSKIAATPVVQFSESPSTPWMAFSPAELTAEGQITTRSHQKQSSLVLARSEDTAQKESQKRRLMYDPSAKYANVDQAQSSLAGGRSPLERDLDVQTADENIGADLMGEDAGVLERTISSFQQEIIKAVLASDVGLAHLDYRASFRSHGSGSTSESSISGQSHSAHPQVAGNRENELPKRSSNENEEDMPKEGDGGRKKRPKTFAMPHGRTSERRLACPYYQRSPGSCQKGACTGPGWWNVTRLKSSHLAREHRRPPQCPRCWTSFDTKVEINQHLKAALICQPQDEPEDDRISDDTWEQLKNQTMFAGAATEEAKWKLLYRTMFPADVHVPSPYYASSSTDVIEDFTGFLQSQMPLLLQEEFEKQLDAHFNPVYHAMLTRLPVMLQRCHQKAQNLYRNRNSASLSVNSDSACGSRRSVDNISTGYASPTASRPLSTQSQTHGWFGYGEAPSGDGLYPIVYDGSSHVEPNPFSRTLATATSSISVQFTEQGFELGSELADLPRLTIDQYYDDIETALRDENGDLRFGTDGV